MILITGSEGLIGKTLVKWLQRDGTKAFTCMDNDLPEDHPHYGDICSLSEEKVDHAELEGVIHLAAVARVIWGQQDPEACWLTNTMGTHNLLRACLKGSPSKAPWFIYASSREVYGQQQQLPVTEDAHLCPMNHYAYTKFSAEQLVNHYKHQGYNTQILRFSSVYGRTDDHADRVIPAFCQAALRQKPLRIDGRENILDFTHVSDVTDAIIHTIQSLREKKALPPALHLTSGIPTTLFQAATLIKQLADSTSTFQDAPPRQYDVSRFCGDPSLAQETLNWTHKTPLKTGLNSLIAAYAAQHASAHEHT